MNVANSVVSGQSMLHYRSGIFFVLHCTCTCISLRGHVELSKQGIITKMTQCALGIN